MNLPVEIVIYILSYTKQNITYRDGKFIDKIMPNDTRYEMFDNIRWKTFLNNQRISRFNICPFQIQFKPLVFKMIEFNDSYFTNLSKQTIPVSLKLCISEGIIENLAEFLHNENQLQVWHLDL